MVNQRLNSQIAPRSIFFSAEPRNAHSFSVYHYLHRPSPLRGRYAAVFRSRIFVGARHIMQIRRPADVTQIAKTIIGFIAIYVVNMAFRPFTRHIKPRKPMFGNSFFADKNAAITIAHFRAGTLTHSVRLVFASQPSKNTRVRVVMHRLAQLFCVNHYNTSVSVPPFCIGGNRNGNLFSGATLAAKGSI